MTSIHVIRAWQADEGRSLTVETNEGRYIPVAKVEVTDEGLGFALVRIMTERTQALPVAGTVPSRKERLYVLRSGTNDRPASFFRLVVEGADTGGTYLAVRPAPGTRHLGSPVLNGRGEIVGMVTAAEGTRGGAPRVLLIGRVLAAVSGCR